MKKKTALITGASRGIGKEIAIALAKRGYHLTLVCLHSKDLILELAQSLENEYHITCNIQLGDVSDSRFAKHIFSDLSQLDVLVNNAGISHVGLLSDMTCEEWNRVISTNLSSVFYFSKHAIPLMLKNGAGKIINISSVWGERGASMEVAYSASKGGLNAFTRALAKELAPSNIQVNAVACGLIDTDMNSCFTKEDLDNVIAEIPSDRIGTPEEVAALVCQLLDSPSYLTGQIITLDGGWT